jgi:hypothetical protein
MSAAERRTSAAVLFRLGLSEIYFAENFNFCQIFMLWF